MSTADGSVLAGSEDGLVGLRQGKVQRMTTKNGLPCNFGHLVHRGQRETLVALHGLRRRRVPGFRAPAMVGQPRSGRSDSCLRRSGWGSAGRTAVFQFCGVLLGWARVVCSGVVVEMVDPSRLSQKALPAQAYIESLVADRKEFKATPNLKVPPNPRDLQIDYTSPTFSIPQKVNFRYRLDGYDRDWHEAGTRRQAFYTDLPPGKYSFRVIASNSDGVWNENAAKLDFSVAPAYYQTNWFRALCAVMFMAMIVGGLPIACAAIATAIRHDAGGARRRANTDCA